MLVLAAASKVVTAAAVTAEAEATAVRKDLVNMMIMDAKRD